MKESLRVDVEPLSEQRWDRIGRSLMARLETEPVKADSVFRAKVRPRPYGWWAAAAVVFVLTALSLSVGLMPSDGAVDEPSRIATGSTASHLKLPGLDVQVDPESAVVVAAETPQGRLVVLDRGSIVCEVAPRAKNAPLIVQAGATRVRVVGTRFSVTRMGEAARVEVYEGVVEVTAGGQTERVSAGQRWPAPTTEARQTLQPSDGMKAEDTGCAATGPSSDVDPNTASARVNRTALNESPSEVRSKQSLPRGGKESAESPEDDSEATHESAQRVFERATALERSDPTRAVKLYRSLESGTSSWAQNALYAHARLEASRGNQSRARRLLERYLKRFPNGSNAEDARAVLRKLR